MPFVDNVSTQEDHMSYETHEEEVAGHTYEVYDYTKTIKSPGKFEGCPRYVPHFWERFMDGAADDDDASSGVLSFNVSTEDTQRFGELLEVEQVRLMESPDGFVYNDTVSPSPEERAKRLGLVTFDWAMPQPWATAVQELTGINPSGHIVWCYDVLGEPMAPGHVKADFGFPVALTRTGRTLLGWYANGVNR